MTTRNIAIVTGSGGRRVGWSVAQALGRRGFAVALHYHRSQQNARDSLAELVSQGVDADLFQADLSDSAQVKRLVAGVMERWGRIDVLVHCAAIWSPKPLEQVTERDVLDNFKANTLSAFLCCQEVGLEMVKQADGGAIVTIGDWAIERPYLNYSAYFASKGAIPTLTRTFAVELASRNPRVRVNAVLPGPVMLPLDLPLHERQEAVAGTLVQREGTPDHVARAVLHFIDNDFVTGTCLPVDGGRLLKS